MARQHHRRENRDMALKQQRGAGGISLSRNKINNRMAEKRRQHILRQRNESESVNETSMAYKSISSEAAWRNK